MLPVAVGAATIADTVTLNRFRSSVPLSFLPVTVTVVEPTAIGSIVITVPDLEVRTMLFGDAPHLVAVDAVGEVGGDIHRVRGIAEGQRDIRDLVIRRRRHLRRLVTGSPERVMSDGALREHDLGPRLARGRVARQGDGGADRQHGHGNYRRGGREAPESRTLDTHPGNSWRHGQYMLPIPHRATPEGTASPLSPGQGTVC